jgi:hypothetical protein
MRMPIMKRIMNQFSNPISKEGGVDLNVAPPRGMKISWDREKGYYYTKAGQSHTNNQGIKETNLMPKKGD